jgi:hypothetical protein
MSCLSEVAGVPKCACSVPRPSTVVTQARCARVPDPLRGAHKGHAPESPPSEGIHENTARPKDDVK